MPPIKKVGYAVVGLGAIAEGSVLPAFGHARHADLVAVVSRDKNKAMRLGRTFKARAYSGDEYEECLANPQVSAVYIATPPGEHAPYAVAAARAGKHVLCEKPLAATTLQSRRIVEAHRRAGTFLMTAYRKYFEPACLYVKHMVANGDLGRIDMIDTAFSELYQPGRSPAWLVDPKLAGGGPLMDLGVYCVNTARWLIDEDPVRVSAAAWRHDRKKFRNVEEGIQFRLEFPSGTFLQASTTYCAALSSFIWIQGTQGWVLLAPAFPFDEERRLTGKVGGRWIERHFKVTDEFAPELDAFATAIVQGKSPQPDGVQGHRDMLIMHAIYQAARRGRTVAVRYN
jgi:predicted dehydrogenase